MELGFALSFDEAVQKDAESCLPELGDVRLLGGLDGLMKLTQE